MKIILVGHTVGIKRCFEALEGSHHTIVGVFTHARHLHEADLALFEIRKNHFEDYAWDVFRTPEEFRVPLFEYASLDDPETIQQMTDLNAEVLATVGCRDILKQSLIDRFTFAINLHPFYLPYFRGAGIDSWMILMAAEHQIQQATCHYIAKGIDSGDIICTSPYNVFPTDRPIDIFKRRIDLLGNLLLQGLENLYSPDFKATPQDATHSSYFPRLNTLRDGKIDFVNWSGDEIVRFIRAFSYPYLGAWALYNDQQLHLLDATFSPSSNIHPFASGLAFRKNNNQLLVFVQDGILTIHAIEYQSKPLAISSLKLGKKFS